MAKFFKGFFITLLILIIVAAGVFIYTVAKLGADDPADILNGLKANNKSITFLLMGADKLDINSEKNSRSDTMILFNYNYETEKINLISIPRDSRVSINGKRHKEKLNHSFNYGGPELTLKTVNEMLGTNIPYYLAVDYDFVKDSVDAVGGVEVDVPMDMQYTDEWDDPPLIIDLKQGLQTLDGNKAIGFLRFRHGYKDADLGRVAAQRQFVESFIHTATTPRGLLGVPKILDSYKLHTKTNIPFENLVELGKNITRSDLSNIETMTLPGNPKYINRISYFIYDKEKSRELVRSLGIE